MDDGDIVMMGDENIPPQEIKDSVAALLRHSGNHKVEGESLFDWSSICEELEDAVNGHECDSADAGRRRCEATLIDILADDHLAGRAKNVFISLPRLIKEQGFEAVTAEMAKLLASDSTACRMRALTELRNLRMRPSQDVAEFCVVLEKLGRQANPESSLEDRSMEYAQILLDNLSGWLEHFQLLGALHKVEPRSAYDEQEPRPQYKAVQVDSVCAEEGLENEGSPVPRKENYERRECSGPRAIG